MYSGFPFQRKACRNGPNCYYLKNNKCDFFHPESHRNAGSNYMNQQSIYPVRRNSNPSQSILEILQREITAQLQTSDRVLDEYQLEGWRSNQRLFNRLFKTTSESEVIQKIEPDDKIYIERDFQVKTTLKNQKRWFFLHSNQILLTCKDLDGLKMKDCAICCEDFNFKEKLIITELYCKHSYHLECIEKWLMESNQCPLCKKDFRRHHEFGKFDQRFQKRIEKEKEKQKESIRTRPQNIPNLEWMPPNYHEEYYQEEDEDEEQDPYYFDEEDYGIE